MLVYDITHQESFDNITNWIENVEEVSTMVAIAIACGSVMHGVYMCILVYIIILCGFLNGVYVA